VELNKALGILELEEVCRPPPPPPHPKKYSFCYKLIAKTTFFLGLRMKSGVVSPIHLFTFFLFLPKDSLCLCNKYPYVIHIKRLL